jgi:hypothetical protein
VTNVKGHDFGALLDNEVNVSTNQDKPFEMPEVPAGKALYVDLDGTLAKEPGHEQRISAEQPAGNAANGRPEEAQGAIQKQPAAQVDERQPGQGGREDGGRVQPVEQGSQPAGESAVQAKPGGEENRPKERYEQIVGAWLRRAAMDQQGQGVLDDMIENGESPRAISDKFWEDTYWKLPGPVQERFQKQLSAHWGGMKPGDTIGSRPDKSAIVARDWWDLTKESDLPTEAEYLEGTDRGYVVLMREANERFGGGPEKVQKGTPEKKPDQLTGGEENRGKEVEPKFKHGNTQADIPPGSDAGKALARMRKAILPEDLAGEGMVNDSHITVRYGIDGGDTAGIRAYLEKQAPFEATLGKTQAFPPSEHSDGAAPIVVPVESADLRRMEKEIDKHGNFVERSFPEYKPHATLAYVKPEEAHRYTGMTETGGQKFTVKSISITDRNGNSEEVQLKGISKPQFSTAARAKVMDRPARTDQIGGGESKPIESSKVEAQPKKPESLTERFKRAQQAKADKYLDTQVRRESGQVLTRRQIIDERMAGGGTTSIKQVQDDAAERKLDRELGAMRRAGVPTGNQSHPTTIKYNELRAQQKAGIKVPSYRIHGADGTEWVVSKTEHDYAQSVEG